MPMHVPMVSTNHARLRSEANKQLTPYVAKVAQQYNKKAGVQIFEVGQHVGLPIPVDHWEKLGDRYIVCMVIQTNPIIATG